MSKLTPIQRIRIFLLFQVGMVAVVWITAIGNLAVIVVVGVYDSRAAAAIALHTLAIAVVTSLTVVLLVDYQKSLKSDENFHVMAQWHDDLLRMHDDQQRAMKEPREPWEE